MKYEIFWKNPGYEPRPALKGDIECDYLIVGGGVTGVGAAYFLAKSDARGIVLIEKNHIASGATGKAAGTLVIRGESDLADIIAKYGEEKGRIYWNEIHEGLRDIKRVAKDEDIDCDAEPQDTLYCDYRHRHTVNLHEEYEAENHVEANTKFLAKEELRKEINSPLFAHGILSENHGLSVNPLKFTQNLSVAIEKYGVKVYENTPLLKTENNIAKTPSGNIRYKKLIMAIDADHPAAEVKNLKSTIVITRPLSDNELEKTGLVKRKIIFDSKKHYDYFKVTKDKRLLIGFGGVIVKKSHKKTDPHPRHLNTIQKFISKLFPYLEIEIKYAWSGTFGVTRDYGPYLKFSSDTVEIAGASTQVVCFMTAKYAVNKILGKPSTLEGFFTI